MARTRVAVGPAPVAIAGRARFGRAAHAAVGAQFMEGYVIAWEHGRSRTASALVGYLPAAQCEVAAQSVRATEQLTPVQPAEHTQRGGSSPTSTHLPFAEQPSPSEHSAACNQSREYN